MAERRATVIWEGSLTGGKGTLSTGSGALQDAPVTWTSRVERSDGKTSPEELMAAAHAECYAMVLTNKLSGEDKTPTRLEVTATCTVEKQDAGLKITTMDLDVRCDDSVDGGTLSRLAQESDADCPVSNALRGNVDIRVHARVSEGAGR
jgi:lipoyl-dependent peroxiredoxin